MLPWPLREFAALHLHVVLVSPRNPLNIGAAARAISNFGFTSLRLVEAYRDAVEEARSGVHSSPVLLAAQEFSTLAGAIADCELVYGTGSMNRREQRLPLDRLEEAAGRLRSATGNVRWCLVRRRVDSRTMT